MSEQLFVRSNNKLGFRRAGTFFPAAGININVADFTNEQLKIIEAEPMLTISEGQQEPTEEISEELLEDIVEAIGILDPDKKPNVKDVEEVLGKDLNAAQRDKAWAVYQERVEQG
ncbi:hypothetical protein IMCC1989_1149 [gamma proteobacterium IMCC1989]|nr:hypothetical protein IMCC1989_1149 [gamma proteobacterium IMCC1989]